MKKLILFFCVFVMSLGAFADTQSLRKGMKVSSERLKEITLLTPQSAPSAAGLQQAASLNDFNNKWCAQYDLMRSSGTRVGFDGMCHFSFYATDSVLITNFYNYGFDLKGTYNAATGKITIMPQFAFRENPYGDFWFCLFDYQQGGFSSKHPVTLTVQPDGTLKSDYGWVIIIPDKTSTYYGIGVGMSEQVTYYKSNATMMGNKRNVADCSFSNAEYRVYVYQSSPDEFTVANVSDQGTEITFQVMPDSTMSAEPQMIYRNLYGVFCAMPAKWSDQPNKSVGVKTDIKVTGDDISVTFGPWGVFNASGLLQCSMGFEYSAILVDEGITIQYPPKGQTITFQGSGTPESPYLISTADDLAKLAKACNLGESFTGKHFRQTADIELPSKVWRPIGLSETVPFAALYDGGNHTITGLKLERGGAENTGLFGYIAAGGGVRNLTVVGSGMSASKYFGLIAGKCYGQAENVHGRGSLTSYAENMGGLFGLATKVKGCSFLGVMPTTQANTGGIAGEIYRDTISNCVVYANIDARQGNTISHGVGGIVGTLSSLATSPTLVVNNYFLGSLYDHTGYSHLGGIGGTGTSNCTYRGNVAMGLMQTAVTDRTIGSCGSIVGNAYNCLVEQNYGCNNLQGTSETTKVGGVVGQLSRFSADKASTMKGNIFTGQVIQTTLLKPDYSLYGRMDDGCKDIDNYFDAQIAGTVPDMATSAKTTAYLTSGDALPGLDPAIWKFQKGSYPVPRFLPEAVAAFASTPIFLNGTQNASNVKTNFTLGQNAAVQWSVMNEGQYVQENNVLAISGNTVTLKGVVGKEFMVATTSIPQGSFSRLTMVGIAPGQFPGAGTADDPYLISTPQDLRTLNSAITSSGQTFKGDYFRMANDIDMTGVTNFWGVSDQSNVKQAFEGTFDGAGHRIKNWKANGIVKDQGGYLAQASSRQSVALFGSVGQFGTVKNVIIDASCDLRASNGVAGVVAINMGRIENCRNYAPITVALNQAGGICGKNTALGVITDCYNEGTITSGYYGPGGIVATNDSATVENCQNAGIVQWAQVTNDHTSDEAACAGGIAAVSTAKAVFRNCVNLGPVIFGNTVGGIVGGYAARVTMDGCIGVGQVSRTGTGTTEEWGPVAASLRSELGFSNTYYDAQIYTIGPAFGRDPEGVTWATTDQLTNGTALAGIPADIMDYVKGQYPSLKAFKDEAATVAYRKMVIFLGEGQTAADVTSDVTLAPQVTWSIPQTPAFAIENGKLVLKDLPRPERVVLTGTVGSYKREFNVQAFRITLKGAGTKENPYQISTPEDFTQFQDLATGCGIHFDGKYFAMTNDVDLSSIDNFRPIAFGGANSFNGVFDGCNHKVTNLKISTNNFKDSVKYGIFGTLGKNGIIRNFEVGSGDVKTYRYAAAIVGLNNGLVENCINRASVSTHFSYDMGGLVAENYGTIQGCTNYGTIDTKASHVGGIAGFNAVNCLVTDCNNYGTMTTGGYSGGIVGNCGGSVKNCNNYGTLTMGGYSGGVVGVQTNANESVEDCTNYGQLTFTGGTVGGVVGTVSGKARNLVNKVDLEFTGTYSGGLIGYTYSKADVKGLKHDKKVTSTKNYVGGIVGSNSGVIDSCVFTGEVRSSAQGNGGIAGYISGTSARIYRSINYGKVIVNGATAFRTGGICGYAGAGYIEDCFNLGDVTSESYSVGGIAGEGYVRVYRCINYGNVTTTYDVASKKNGNAGGIVGHNGSEIRDCINYGTVTGKRYVGGLIGRPNTSTKAACCYVSAKVISQDPATTGMGVNLSADQTKVVIDSIYYNTTVMSDAQQSEAAAAKVVGLSDFELCQVRLGSAFDHHEYALPTLKYFVDNGDANLLATIVVFTHSGESFNNFINSAYMMLLPGVVYQGSPYIIYEENASKLRANGDNKGQQASITLKAPTLERTFSFILNNNKGVGSIDNGKPVASQRIFTLQGVELSETPVGVPVVVVTVYTDGTSVSQRMIFTDRK